MELKKSEAVFSSCKKYRYSLTRIWDNSKKLCIFICLNPSTADASKNDNTITRCIKYASNWGYGGLVMLNAFAFRATDPKEMKAQRNPVGTNNNYEILKWCNDDRVGIIICGWGNNGMHKDRNKQMKKLLTPFNVYSLKNTISNQPGHPLYLKSDLEPITYKY